MSKCKSSFIRVNPWLIQIPESTFNEKNMLISGKTYEVLTTFYAKQTQFTGCQNERKLLLHKGL